MNYACKTRSICRYTCVIDYTIKIAGICLHDDHSFPIVVPFCERQLNSRCGIRHILPRPWMDAKVSFHLNNKEPLTEQEYLNRKSNYEAIRLAVVKELLFVIMLEIFTSPYNLGLYEKK